VYVKKFVDDRRCRRIVDVVLELAAELAVSPAVLALSWVRDRPLVVAPLVGARTAEQLKESLGAWDFVIPDDVRARLDDVSAPHLGYPERSSMP
jgi:aryl-alcohol dehydrogenase-like predicted oxidoreductase